MSGPRPSAQDSVLRVRWVPGTDVLVGTCTCAAQYECQSPVDMWDWLLAHPDHPAIGEDPAGERHS